MQTGCRGAEQIPETAVLAILAVLARMDRTEYVSRSKKMVV